MTPERIAELRNETSHGHNYYDDEINECLDAIEALQAENARITAALGGLVHAVDELMPGTTDYDVRVHLARAAMASGGGK